MTAGSIAGFGNETSNKFVPEIGVGLQYDFTKTISARLEAQRYMKVGNSNTGTADVDLYSGGIVFKF